MPGRENPKQQAGQLGNILDSDHSLSNCVLWIMMLLMDFLDTVNVYFQH